MKLTKLLKEILSEGKQVGTLYRWVSFKMLENYLKSNSINASPSNEDDYGSISFTRSPHALYWMDFPNNETKVLLMLNGDKISNSYKIQPHNDHYTQIKNSLDGEELTSKEAEEYLKTPFANDEFEERIYKDLKNLDRYIIKVILPEPNKEIESLLKQKNIPYTLKSPLNESATIEVPNPDYFKQVLDQSNGLSPASRRYIQKIIDSVKKNSNLASQRQYGILQRLKTGDFKYHSKN